MTGAVANRKPHEIEGIYHTKDTSYRVALVKTGTGVMDYKGVVLSSKNPRWKPGDVKLELKKEKGQLYRYIVYNADHAAQLDRLDFTNENALKFYGWVKESSPSESVIAGNSGSGKPPVVLFDRERSEQPVFFETINDSTSYIRIKSFAVRNAATIDSVMAAHVIELESRPNLIVDIRGNGGGGDISYRSLKKYMYTQPIHSIGVDFYATPENIDLFIRLVKEAGLPAEDEREYVQMAESARKSGQQMFNFADDLFDTLSNVLMFPKTIAILIDGKCASTAEQFLLEAVQSKKIRLYGQATQGVLDYSNVCGFKIDGIPAELNYPTTRSRRIEKGLGIDNKGIQPHRTIDFSEDSWLQMVLADL